MTTTTRLPIFGLVRNSDLTIVGVLGVLGAAIFLWPKASGNPPPPPPPPAAAQVLSVRKDPNVTGTTAGIICTVSGAVAGQFSYTLSAPTAVGSPTRTSGANAPVNEEFFFPPGSHQVTCHVTDSAGSHNTIASFTIDQSLALLNVSYQNS